ncbi:MAG: hypothetical protein AVDCRST_MAG33-2080, partial [uncultured Thermomicrobiales bacterium]
WGVTLRTPMTARPRCRSMMSSGAPTSPSSRASFAAMWAATCRLNHHRGSRRFRAG